MIPFPIPSWLPAGAGFICAGALFGWVALGQRDARIEAETELMACKFESADWRKNAFAWRENAAQWENLFKTETNRLKGQANDLYTETRQRARTACQRSFDAGYEAGYAVGRNPPAHGVRLDKGPRLKDVIAGRSEAPAD